MTKDEIRTYCLYQHMAEFIRQGNAQEIADWSKPCQDCRLLQSNDCSCDWYGNIADAKPDGIRFNLCRMEPACKSDTHRHG
jgi:hypothetical protein